MKILYPDDLEIGQFVTILKGPFKEHWVPQQIRGEEPNPREDQCTMLGHVFELVAFDRPLVMLKPLTAVTTQCASPHVAQLGPLASIISGSTGSVQSSVQPLMFSMDNISLAKVDPSWVEAFLDHFGGKRQSKGKVADGSATATKLIGFKKKDEKCEKNDRS